MIVGASTTILGRNSLGWTKRRVDRVSIRDVSVGDTSLDVVRVSIMVTVGATITDMGVDDMDVGDMGAGRCQQIPWRLAAGRKTMGVSTNTPTPPFQVEPPRPQSQVRETQSN